MADVSERLVISMDLNGSFNASFKKEEASHYLREWLGSGTGAIQDPQTEIEVRNVRAIKIPVVKVVLNYSTTWRAEIGHLNEPAYNQANALHALLMHAHRTKSEEERKNSIEPMAPLKSVYINYTQTTGMHEGKINFSARSQFNRIQHQISEEEKKFIDAICSRIQNDYFVEAKPGAEFEVGNDNDEAHYYEEIKSLTEQEIYLHLCKQASEIIVSEIAKKIMPEHYRNLSIIQVEPDGTKYRFYLDKLIEYPVFLISYQWRAKLYTCAMDGRDGSVIEGQKAYRALLERTVQTVVAVNKTIDKTIDAVAEAAGVAAENALESVQTWWNSFWKK